MGVSAHEAIKGVLSLPVRHSNRNILYVPTGLKNNRTGILKSLSILKKMHPDDRNVFSSNITQANNYLLFSADSSLKLVLG